METSAGTACEPQLLTPLRLHTIGCLGPRATTTPRWFARRIQNWHPAASCAGGLCIPKGICVRTGLQQRLPKLWVRALQPRSYRSICGIGANGVALYFRVRPPAPLGRLLPGLYAVLVKMMPCNKLLFPLAVKPGWFLSYTVGCTIRVSLILGSDPVSYCLQRDRPTFSTQHNRPKPHYVSFNDCSCTKLSNNKH